MATSVSFQRCGYLESKDIRSEDFARKFSYMRGPM